MPTGLHHPKATLHIYVNANYSNSSQLIEINQNWLVLCSLLDIRLVNYVV